MGKMKKGITKDKDLEIPKGSSEKELTEKEIIGELRNNFEAAPTIQIQNKRKKSVKDSAIAENTDDAENSETSSTENSENSEKSENSEGIESIEDLDLKPIRITVTDSEIDAILGRVENSDEYHEEEVEADVVYASEEIAESERPEEVKSIVEALKERKLSNEADPGCPFCHGVGYVPTETGEYVDCECVIEHRRLEALAQVKKNEEEIREKKIKTALYSDDIKKRMWQLGLIHPENVDRIFTVDKFKSIMSTEKVQGKLIRERSTLNLLSAFNNIIYSISHNKKTHSYLLHCPFPEINEDFAYTVIKAGAMYGKSVVPYNSLLRIAKKKTEYIMDATWRRGDGYLTREEELMLKFLTKEQQEEFYRLKANPEEMLENQDFITELVAKSVVEYIEPDKQELVYNNRKNRYTYQDYVEADILVCWLSSIDSVYTESNVLETLLQERSMDCKPTIILTERDIKNYKSKKGMPSDLVLLDNVIADASRVPSYRIAEYVGLDMKKTDK